MTDGSLSEALYALKQIRALGEPYLVMIVDSHMTMNKQVSLGLRGVEIKDNGVLRGIAESGRDPLECAERIYTKLKNLPEGQAVVVNASSSTRREYRFDHEFGSWVRVNGSDFPLG